MDETTAKRWSRLVASFRLRKTGAEPWDASTLDESFSGASHGEKCTIRFLLNLWNADCDWSCGPFDFFDAYATWDDESRDAFLAWAKDPWWP